jgi:preprotein translocase subunit SecF
MKRTLFSTLLILCLTSAAFAQISTETTIDEKFSELITSSNNFKGYKVVDSDELSRLQSLTSQRISELKEEIATGNQNAQAQKEKIGKLKADLEIMEAKLNEVTSEKDSIDFIGMPFSKSSYKSMMWGIVGVLVLALGLFVYRFKKSHVHTQEARKNLEETEKEFEAFRAKSLEKEQRLGRLLQDEKNKQLKLAK